jgi:hypothetical protein
LKLSFFRPGIPLERADRPANKKLNTKGIMKRWMPWMIGTATLCAAATLALGADDMLPGQVDFGAFTPPKGDGQFVEVNVSASLISLASKLVEKDDPDVAKLLGGLKLVRVNVISLDDDNRAELQKRAQKITKDLASKGWEKVVTAHEKDQDVSVYVKMNDKGAIQGLAAVVLDGKDQAVFANVVGEIRPEQLALLGEKLHIDPLKKIGITPQKPEDKSEDKPKEKTGE